jgi:Ca2+-binding RTX toxin-like protein
LSRDNASSNAAILLKSILPNLSSKRLNSVFSRFYRLESADHESASSTVDSLQLAGSTLISAIDRFKSLYESGDLDVALDLPSEDDSLGIDGVRGSKGGKGGKGDSLSSAIQNESSLDVIKANGDSLSTTIKNASSLDVIKAMVKHSLPNGLELSDVSFYGSSSDDRLIGDSNSNIISGGDGDDTIFGRGGDDFLIGGSGKDTFRISSGSDVIVDFEKGIDMINMSGLTYDVDFSLEEFVGPSGLLSVRIIADNI